jgi:hypothetical protein
LKVFSTLALTGLVVAVTSFSAIAWNSLNCEANASN